MRRETVAAIRSTWVDGADQAHGNDGKDTLWGGAYWDSLYGEAAADVTYDAESEILADYRYGGSGNDAIHMDDGDSSADYGFGAPERTLALKTQATYGNETSHTLATASGSLLDRRGVARRLRQRHVRARPHR
ncbi:MAG: hypothetical protein ACXWYT_10780 [Actinomycetota bacterium]